MSAEPEVVDNADESRFEIRVDGSTAGFAEYKLSPEKIAFTHTEIDESYSGRGLAGALVRSALDDVSSRGLAVLPFCPYVRSWIAKHPDYVDLVPADQRARFHLE
ncbi:GNAT family N-acetyltransferase [Saccharopolyspora griseoalba]|uniref:GNAT family N-acetyltransferase n=1 Tax=Saccharopolyspora griseoalba TaxID=1431848 RepID=A0ABW2LG96_9PSEU